MWNVLSVSWELNLSKFFNLSLKIPYWEIERTRQMTNQEDKINLGEMACDNNNQGENLGPVWDKRVPGHWLCFCPNFFVLIFLIIVGCFCRNHLWKACDELTVWVHFLCSAAEYILPLPRQRTRYSLQKIASTYGWSVRPRQASHTFFCNLLEIGTFQPKIDKLYFFYQHLQPFSDLMQKKNW